MNHGAACGDGEGEWGGREMKGRTEPGGAGCVHVFVKWKNRAHVVDEGRSCLVYTLVVQECRKKYIYLYRVTLRRVELVDWQQL